MRSPGVFGGGSQAVKQGRVEHQRASDWAEPCGQAGRDFRGGHSRPRDDGVILARHVGQRRDGGVGEATLPRFSDGDDAGRPIECLMLEALESPPLLFEEWASPPAWICLPIALPDKRIDIVSDHQRAGTLDSIKCVHVRRPLELPDVDVVLFGVGFDLFRERAAAMDDHCVWVW